MARPFARRRAKAKTIALKRKLPKNKVNLGLANDVVKDVWDPRKTVIQNYQKMGLLSSLKGYSGTGINKSLKNIDITCQLEDFDTFNQVPEEDELNPVLKINPGVEKIGFRISKASITDKNILEPALKSSETSSAYVDILSKKAQEIRSRDKTVRHCSMQEKVFLEKMITKHGLNYVNMARDIDLNIFQLSPGAIKNKIKKLNIGLLPATAH